MIQAGGGGVVFDWQVTEVSNKFVIFEALQKVSYSP